MARHLILATTILAFSVSPALARDQLRIAGSSTVYPFVTAAAEAFGKGGQFKTPIVESTGTGGGFKLFCGGVGEDTPDISNASRPITESEKELCRKNGVTEVTEVKIGFDGIVLAQKKAGKPLDLTKKQIFLALARKVPKEGALVDNFYKQWSDIDPALPKIKIEVYGPPPTSGTRDAFVEMVMEKACAEFPEFAAAIPDEKQRKQTCHMLREDGGYIEAGEDDNLIISKLSTNATAVGILGYSFVEENLNKVQGSLVDGVAPTFENIEGGKYGISRSLFVYVKNQHVGKIPGIKEFVTHLVSDQAIGSKGYIIDRGLLPLPAAELKKVQATVAGMK